MSAFRIDGAVTSAQVQGGPRKSFPFEGDNASFVLEQDYIVALTSFSPLALDTAHGTYTNAYLVKESQQENIGGGLVKWTRTYAQIPANRSDYETFNFKFPGLLSTTGNTETPYDQYWVQAGNGRDPFTATSNSRVLSEYFLCASGQTYTTPSSIPILQAIKFTLDSNTDARIDYLLSTVPSYWSNSDPTKEEWIALVAGGTGIGTGAAAGEFIAEDSRITRWMGNIYCRQTRYVKAL